LATPEASYEVVPVGYVRSELTDVGRAPMQGREGAPAAVLVFSEPFIAALDGLSAGDDVMVLCWLHRADREVLIVHPRDDLTRPRQGVFSTRSSHRPNPIGLHRVRILAINGSEVEVSPLEAVDGTPVLDVKPVLRAER